MFGRNKPLRVPASRDIGLLGPDTEFRGTIRFAGTLRIEGQVEGDVLSAPGSGAVLIVNQHARVVGDIVADAVLISGEVLGDVRAAERVEVYRSGRLRGDIHTGDIMIEGGATFEGQSHMVSRDDPDWRERLLGHTRAPGGNGGAHAPAAAEDAAGAPGEVPPRA